MVSPQHETMAALVDKGFTVPEQIDAEHLLTRNHFEAVWIVDQHPLALGQAVTVDGASVPG